MEDITEGDIKRIKHQALFLVHPKLRDGGSTEIRFPVPWAWDPGAAPKESRKVAMGADDANEVSVEGVAWVLDDSLWACFERANSHYLLFARSSNAP